MAAVARPRFDKDNNCTFDGKIGIWPFVVKEAAKRKSKNRPKGTIETKCVESVDQAEIRKMMFNNLIPAVRQKWPKESKSEVIFLQQDNAKPHLGPYDAELLKEGTKYGWNIQLKPQPPNSPDFNALDLGFFNSIQSLQYKTSPNSIDELILEVEKAFVEITPETLDNVFLSFQKSMECSMKEKGSNNFKLAHMKKAALRRRGLLPTSVQCSQELIESCNEFLSEDN